MRDASSLKRTPSPTASLPKSRCIPLPVQRSSRQRLLRYETAIRKGQCFPGAMESATVIVQHNLGTAAIIPTIVFMQFQIPITATKSILPETELK